MSQETAENEPNLKDALVSATEGETTTDDLLDVVNTFLQTTVYLPSVEKPGEDGSISPLMLQDPEENPVMPLFTAPEQIPEEYGEHAPHVAVVAGMGVLQSVTNAAVIIDPGADHQFPLSQEQMAAIREQVVEQTDGAGEQG